MAVFSLDSHGLCFSRSAQDFAKRLQHVVQLAQISETEALGVTVVVARNSERWLVLLMRPYIPPVTTQSPCINEFVLVFCNMLILRQSPKFGFV